MKSQTVFVALLGAVGFSTSALAVPIVRFHLDVDPAGTFELSASASLGDNEGIISYGFPLVGDILTLSHVSPAGIGNGSLGGGGVGFSLFRSASVMDPVNSVVVSGSQDVFKDNGAGVAPGAYLTFNMGQTSGNIEFDSQPPPNLLFIPEAGANPIYAATFLVATGTWDVNGNAPIVDTSHTDFGANVFGAGSTRDQFDTVAATVVPEPSAFLLSGLFLCGIVAQLVWRSARAGWRC